MNIYTKALISLLMAIIVALATVTAAKAEIDDLNVAAETLVAEDYSGAIAELESLDIEAECGSFAAMLYFTALLGERNDVTGTTDVGIAALATLQTLTELMGQDAAMQCALS